MDVSLTTVDSPEPVPSAEFAAGVAAATAVTAAADAAEAGAAAEQAGEVASAAAQMAGAAHAEVDDVGLGLARLELRLDEMEDRYTALLEDLVGVEATPPAEVEPDDGRPPKVTPKPATGTKEPKSRGDFWWGNR